VSHPGAYAAYALGLLTLINVLNYVDRNVVFALFEPLKRDLTLSDQQLGWLGSAYVIVLSLAALPLGVVGDLKSRRAVITFSVALWSVFTALGGAVRHFWQLFFCRAMVGVGEAGYGPAAQGLIAAYFQGRRRAFAIGIYSVGMALGGVLGIWVGGVLEARFGWRRTFVFMGVPGVLLALLASQLREPARQAPTGLVATMRRWLGEGVRGLLRLTAPLIALTLVGAAVSAALAAIGGTPAEADAAVFAVFISIGIVWTVMRLIPIAIQRTTAATEVAATALEEFLHAAATVLRTPTLVWIFLGGALVTFAVNGLIAWSPSFMHRVHGLSVAAVGRQFGLFALAGGVLGAWRAAGWATRCCSAGAAGGSSPPGSASCWGRRCAPPCCWSTARRPSSCSSSPPSSSTPGTTVRCRPASSTWCRRPCAPRSSARTSCSRTSRATPSPRRSSALSPTASACGRRCCCSRRPGWWAGSSSSAR